MRVCLPLLPCRTQLCAPAAIQSLVAGTLQTTDEKCVCAAVTLLAELSTTPAAAEELLQLHGMQLFVQLLMVQGMWALNSSTSIACFKGIASLAAACQDLQLLSSSGALYLLVEALKVSNLYPSWNTPCI